MADSNIKRRIFNYCAYQERTIRDVEKKLSTMDLPANRIQELIQELIQENFIDESRYVESFVNGKLRIKKWGRLKIKAALRSKGLSADLISAGLDRIDEDEYRDAIAALISSKANSVVGGEPMIRKGKVVRYLLGKGFESELVWEKVNQMEW